MEENPGTFSTQPGSRDLFGNENIHGYLHSHYFRIMRIPKNIGIDDHKVGKPRKKPTNMNIFHACDR